MEQLNKERELTREERLEIEEKAIQALVNMGVKFNVPLKINPVKPPRFIRWWNRYFPNHVKMCAKSGKAPGQFIEVMACEGGCITGPSTHSGSNGKRQLVQELAKQEKTY